MQYPLEAAIRWTIAYSSGGIAKRINEPAAMEPSSPPVNIDLNIGVDWLSLVDIYFSDVKSILDPQSARR